MYAPSVNLVVLQIRQAYFKNRALYQLLHKQSALSRIFNVLTFVQAFLYRKRVLHTSINPEVNAHVQIWIYEQKYVGFR